jgi:hypothetical protein
MQELDPLEADTFLQQISGSKIIGGVISSPDGKIKIDLDAGTFTISNGVQNLIQLGVLSDGTIGMLIQDSQGNLLMQISESTQLIQSNNKAMIIDLILEQIAIYDAFKNLRVLVGKDVGGF